MTESLSLSEYTLENSRVCAHIHMDDGKANAIQEDWCRQLNTLLDQVEHSEFSSLILSARSGYFCAGLDTKRLPTLSAADMHSAVQLFVNTMRRLFLFPKPIIAVSEGHTLAGGMILFLTADYRIALDNDQHRYGLNEVTLGVPMIGSNAGICQASIPAHFHPDLILHCQQFSAAQLYQRNIIQQLTPAPEFSLSAALKVAAQFSLLKNPAYSLTKRALRQPFLDKAQAQQERLKAEIPSGNLLAGINLN